MEVMKKSLMSDHVFVIELTWWYVLVFYLLVTYLLGLCVIRKNSEGISEYTQNNDGDTWTNNYFVEMILLLISPLWVVLYLLLTVGKKE